MQANDTFFHRVSGFDTPRFAGLRTVLRLPRLGPERDSVDFLRLCPAQEGLIRFHVLFGLAPDGLTGATGSRPVDARDVPGGRRYQCQLRARARVSGRRRHRPSAPGGDRPGRSFGGSGMLVDDCF